jgi:hypothetical protein
MSNRLSEVLELRFISDFVFLDGNKKGEVMSTVLALLLHTLYLLYLKVDDVFSIVLVALSLAEEVDHGIEDEVLE